jgi:hypothetical protein
MRLDSQDLIEERRPIWAIIPDIFLAGALFIVQFS